MIIGLRSKYDPSGNLRAVVVFLIVLQALCFTCAVAFTQFHEPWSKIYITVIVIVTITSLNFVTFCTLFADTKRKHKIVRCASLFNVVCGCAIAVGPSVTTTQVMFVKAI